MAGLARGGFFSGNRHSIDIYDTFWLVTAVLQIEKVEKQGVIGCNHVFCGRFGKLRFEGNNK